ncbi:MAG: GtrA family protein [Clostridia bacterium]|jgi:putative flippase GtrA|nr:GtrA family protein [Clostridia bacterium]
MNKEFRRTVKYVLIAASAGIIQFGTFTLLNEVFHLDYWLSYLIALVLSVLWNFTFNRRYTFKSASNVPKAMLLVFAYYCVFTPLSTMLEHYLTRTLGWNEYVVTIINMLLNLATEFPFQRFVVFRKTIDTNDIAERENEDNNSVEGETI